ncbi:vesicle-associated protein 1-1 [Phtheirospermum japonicum]|uniref:Vesicle-associated protein 1-1 n=1 Tax=Phtheirospermum japonicum TaxID=374723 RepID=A0A830C746_9LAMI|nr:vesicle-associated protein 1-1 [Phtheirospermum japonicum]
MGRKKLLRIEPQEELTFRFEPRRQNPCTVRLSNNSQDHVAFKVMTTNPEKYRVRPKTGLLLPRSNRDVKVSMRAPEEASSNMQCKDQFLIKSVAVSPNDTAESSRILFKEEGHMVQSCKLRVVYEFPSRQQPSDVESNLNAAQQRWKAGSSFVHYRHHHCCLVVSDFWLPHHEDAATHMEFERHNHDVGSKDDVEADAGRSRSNNES